jgi:CheY-like chemotaxis protein
MDELSGKRVFLVEDEALVLWMMADMLKGFGCTVEHYSTTAKDALDHAEKTTCDVAILDVNLDGASSYPIAEVLKQRGIPFVFATGYGERKMSEDYPDVAVLHKPIDFTAAKRVLATALKRVTAER